MKKILFIDPLSPTGHIQYNNYWINCLNNLECSYETCFKKNYKKNFDLKEKSYEIEEKYYLKLEKSKNFFIKRYYLFLILKEIEKKVNFEDYDKIIFSSFENFSLFIYLLFYKNKNIYAILHNNIQKINNKIIYFLIKSISKKINLISLDENIKENLEKIKINTGLVIHPIPNKFKLNTQKDNHIIKIFSPSKTSIDENFILELLGAKKLLKNLKLEFFIRNTKLEMKIDNLTISKRYLSDEEYRDKFSEAEIIILPYKKDFQNRLSNIFFEAVSNEKKILISEESFLKIYSKYETRGIRYYSETNKFENELVDLIQEKSINYEILKFKFSFKEMLKNIKENILSDCNE